MSKFEESNFYKALQDFFINADKKTFLQFLAEFSNRTEGIIDKDNIQDDLIKELRELYLEFNDKGIDENIVREKVNYFLENSIKIKDVITKLDINTNKIEDNTEKLNTNTSNIENITLQLDTKADLDEVFLVNNGININNFDEETRRTFLQLQGIDVNYVLGKGNVHLENLNFIDVDRQNIFDKSKAKIGYMLNSSGVENANQSAFVSDYINIKGYETLSTNASWNSAFYGVNKEFIQLITSPHSSPISVPETAYYIKIVGGVNKIDEVMLTPGETLPSSYVDYNNYSINITDTKFINDIINKTYKKINYYNNVLVGKSALYFGDSICYGEGYRGGYAKLISENNNMTYTNKGVSGATITRREGVSCILDTVLNSTETADYIILEGGTNDAGGFQEFGEITTGYTATLNETTFCGAVESLIKNSLIKWHDKKICFILTTNTHRRPDQKHYFDTIKQICEKWSIPYLDLFTKGRLNTNIEIMKNSYTSDWQGSPDGLHPNEQGYKLFYVDQITEFLKTI